MAFFTRAGNCFLIINILEVASFDGCIKTPLYGVTYIAAGFLAKIREAYTFNVKVYLKESGRIDQNYRTWIAVTQVIKSDMIPVELGAVSNHPGVCLGQQKSNQR